MPDEAELSSVCPTIGEVGIGRVVAAFYRQVPGDDVLGPMYPPQELAAAEARLRDFLIFRFGGADRYIQQRGHPRLRQRHAPFALSQEARDHWVALMDRALEEAELPPNIAAIMREFLHQTATFLINS
ncbi:MAG: hemoglobin [Planctomycetota bacterium]|nr:MAG: hemoglobin [Planctomycetota bacterium]